MRRISHIEGASSPTGAHRAGRRGWGPALALVAAIALLGSACADPRVVRKTLADAEATLVEANRVHARICAPEPMANAESGVGFTRVEMQQGYVRRAGEHASFSYKEARRAVEEATPCGTADRDRDTIPDVVDQCPDEPEDFDGVEDQDGCRDIDPRGDEDGDGIINVDDACIFEPEDFDGHDDEDGCPETSDDSDGDGLIDAVDKCPKAPEDFDGFQDNDGCPDPDNDNDNVVDTRDQCPLIPEDLDNWEDEDGCPEPDNDADGIPDTYDRCPNQPGPRENEGCPTLDRDNDGIADSVDACIDQPETYNQYLDEDGCPDTPPTKVQVTRKRINIDEMIQFEFGKATLLPESYPILDSVVKVMQDAPAMKVRIEGHTDSVGSDEANLSLSQERATSVRAYLIKQGIEANRLEAKGLGETQPLDTNRTDEGRAKNRRVEFHIVEQ